MNIKISVVMSVYNEEEKWLKSSIESILTQTYKNFEFIIIVDNPNREDLIEIINHYKEVDDRIILSINEKNMGLVYSLNKGLRMSTGQYIARMDADDICIEDRFEKQLDYFNKNDVDLLVTRAHFINEEDQKIGQSIIFKNSNQLMKSLKYKNRLIHPTWMIKRDVIFNEKINLYKDIPYAEDYDIAYRLVLNGFKIHQLNEYCLYYRVRKDGISLLKYYDGLKSSTFIAKNIKFYHNKKYVRYEEDLQKLVFDSNKNRCFNWIDKNIKSDTLKKLLLVSCKYYRIKIINSIKCRIILGI